MLYIHRIIVIIIHILSILRSLALFVSQRKEGKATSYITKLRQKLGYKIPYNTYSLIANYNLADPLTITQQSSGVLCLATSAMLYIVNG